MLVTGNSSDHGDVAVGTDVGDVGAGRVRRRDELQDLVEEVGILFVDVVVAQAAHGQEVVQVKPRVRRFIIALGLWVVCSAAAEDALAAGQIVIGICRSGRSGQEGVLAGEKLQGVLESALGCSVFATDRANAKVASGGRSRGQRRSNSLI